MTAKAEFLSIQEIYDDPPNETRVVGFQIDVTADAYGYVQMYVVKPGRDWVREFDLEAVKPWSGTRGLPPPMQYDDLEGDVRTGYRWSRDPFP